MVPQAAIGVKDLIGFKVKSGCGYDESFCTIPHIS